MSGLFLCMPQHLETALESTSLKMPFSLFVHLMALGQVSLSCNNLRRNSQRYVVVPSRDFRFIGMPSGPILGLRAFFFNCKNKIEGKLVFIHFLGLRAFFFNCKNKREGKLLFIHLSKNMSYLNHNSIFKLLPRLPKGQ